MEKDLDFLNVLLTRKKRSFKTRKTFFLGTKNGLSMALLRKPSFGTFLFKSESNILINISLLQNNAFKYMKALV